ncbi:MAG: MFS transporter [Ilumatobacter sp.]|nr:MFS transporter [Ilumatobacter sp.]
MSRNVTPVPAGIRPDDLDPLEQALLDRIAALDPDAGGAGSPLSPIIAAELFEAQSTSRIVDHTARWLRSVHGLGYYTIGSAGHEANAAVALALRPTDPALLHYRSGGFYFGRATQVADQDPVGDVLRGMLARTTEPIAGGRHKVFGSAAMHIIPQTSTIASHLPRAVGLATSIGADGEATGRWPGDAVVVCSFGDASLNHSTAQGALNWAAHTAYRGGRVPILFVCEDNGLGISVPTPQGWVAASTAGRPGLRRVEVDGDDPGAVIAATTELAEGIRRDGRPALLHLHTVRYLGHAGTDVESAYRSAAARRADLDRDPILGTARALVAGGDCSGDDLVDWFLGEREATRARALELLDEPEFSSVDAIVAPLSPRSPAAVAERARIIGRSVPARGADAPGLTLAQSINDALRRILVANPQAILFGEDVAAKGGVYGVTRGLRREFGAERVFDTLLDEQSVLGLALGAGLNGWLPIPEIQYLAYLHNAEDQLRGEAASLAFFSQGQYRNPMVVRVAGYGYQRGFGGHFHNDNAVAVLRDIPGLIIASPSHPRDAGRMLMTCVAAAETDGTVCVFLEPIARYHTADLHEDGDGLWLDDGDDPSAPPTPEHVPVGSAAVHGGGVDGTIITWGNGCHLARRAQRRLRREHDERWRVVDMRWLAPMPVDDMLREANATGRVLVVDETRRSGGVGEGIVTELVEAGYRGELRRVAAVDTFVPLGAAADLVLVSEDQIIEAAVRSD